MTNATAEQVAERDHTLAIDAAVAALLPPERTTAQFFLAAASAAVQLVFWQLSQNQEPDRGGNARQWCLLTPEARAWTERRRRGYFSRAVLRIAYRYGRLQPQ